MTHVRSLSTKLGQPQARDAYVDKLKAQIDEWNAQIDQWEAKAKQAEADTKIAYEQQLEGLRRQRGDAQNKLDEIQSASGQAWEDLKSSTEQAFSNLRAGIERAASHFK